MEGICCGLIFFPGLDFIFLFGGMVIYDNEFETKGNKN